MEVRYVLIGAHYRKPLNFTLDSLSGAREALAKLAKGARNLAAKMGGDTVLDNAGFGPFQAAWDSLNNDLNTPAALGGLFTGLREASSLTGRDAAAALAGFNRILRALGLTLPEEASERHPSRFPRKSESLADTRWQARLAKNWAESDTLRDQLAAQGWIVKDGKDGYTLDPPPNRRAEFISHDRRAESTPRPPYRRRKRRPRSTGRCRASTSSPRTAPRCPKSIWKAASARNRSKPCPEFTSPPAQAPWFARR